MFLTGAEFRAVGFTFGCSVFVLDFRTQTCYGRHNGERRAQAGRRLRFFFSEPVSSHSDHCGATRTGRAFAALK